MPKNPIEIIEVIGRRSKTTPRDILRKNVYSIFVSSYFYWKNEEKLKKLTCCSGQRRRGQNPLVLLGLLGQQDA
jgi:hypothetical protein